MSLYVLMIPADESIQAKKVLIDESKTLSELQSAVGGYIEGMTIGRTAVFSNEEGKIEGLAGNVRATRYVGAKGVNLPMMGDFLCGTCVVASYDDEGETRSVLDADLALFVENFGPVEDHPTPA